jgi:gluconolactonase
MKILPQRALVCVFALFNFLAAVVAEKRGDSAILAGEKLKQLTAADAGEGPAWHVPSQSLYFTGGNRITRLDSNQVSHVFRGPSGGANGLLFDPEGRLVVCESANRRITRTESSGSIIVLADSYEGKKFNSPNDLAIDSQRPHLLHGSPLWTARQYGNARSRWKIDRRSLSN